MKPSFVDIVYSPRNTTARCGCAGSGLFVSSEGDPKKERPFPGPLAEFNLVARSLAYGVRLMQLVIGNQRVGSLNQTQQTGTNNVAIAAIHATAENPDASKADAEIVAIAAMPT